MSWTTSKVTCLGGDPGAGDGRWRSRSSSGCTPRAPSETLYHASFGAAGMARADIGSLTASPHVKLVAVADVDLRNTAEVKKRFPGVKVYQDWRELLDKEKNLELGQRLDAGPHARPDHHAGHAAGAARLHPEAADADDLRGPAARPGGPREEARHPDGHPDPLARGPPDGRRDDPGRGDRQGEGGP